MSILGTLTIDPTNNRDEVLTKTLEDLAEARAWPPRVLFGFQVACDEWISNVIKYSYEGVCDWRINIEVKEISDAAQVIVKDSGKSFDPANASLPADLSDTLRGEREGGMGLMMMHHLMDSISYRYDGTSNIVTLQMKLN